jgi:hypothetical protein
MLTLTLFLPTPMGGGFSSPGPPCLPWLISTLTILAVALNEEIKMLEKHGEKYLKYRNSTPFMLPLPRQLSELTTRPAKFSIKKNMPENRKELAYTITIYGITLILPSFIISLILIIL